MLTLLFIYLLVAIRIAVNVFSTASRLRATENFKHLAQPFLRQGPLAIFLWPLDFLFMPIDFIKGYLLLDRNSLFRIHYYYGRRSR